MLTSASDAPTNQPAVDYALSVSDVGCQEKIDVERVEVADYGFTTSKGVPSYRQASGTYVVEDADSGLGAIPRHNNDFDKGPRVLVLFVLAQSKERSYERHPGAVFKGIVFASQHVGSIL